MCALKAVHAIPPSVLGPAGLCANHRDPPPAHNVFLNPNVPYFSCSAGRVVIEGHGGRHGYSDVDTRPINRRVSPPPIRRWASPQPPPLPPSPPAAPATPPSSPLQCATGWDFNGTNCFQAFASSSYCSCSGCGCPDMWTFCASQHLSSSVATDNEFTTWRTQNPGYVCQGTNGATYAGGTSCYFPTSTCQDGVFDGDCSGSSHKLLCFPQGTVWGWIAEAGCCDTSRNVLCVYSSS